MKTQRNSFLFILLLVAPFSRAQETVYRLSSEHLLAVVRAYHPVIKQTGLQIKRAESEIQTARGSFDPTVSAELKRKAFTGKLYYSYFNPEITIPTWYGVDIKAGIQEVLGQLLDRQAILG
jgi:outer membrane protein TolC